MIYVASTSGRVSGLSIKAKPFEITWSYESGSPIFGSLAMDYLRENVICCLVDGHVVALSSKGCVTWKVLIGGPIFAGVCISSVLPSQALVCSRDGTVYSLDVEDGEIVWEYKTGDPITASAYVDEHSLVQTNSLDQCDRLACICTSSGEIHVLRINPNAKKEKYNHKKAPIVRQFAVMEIPGDVFSSPVMIGGRIFVGCRDDYVRCIAIS